MLLDAYNKCISRRDKSVAIDNYFDLRLNQVNHFNDKTLRLYDCILTYILI